MRRRADQRLILATLNVEHAVVDFHKVFTLPRRVTQSLLKARNQQRIGSGVTNPARC
jgi:hypothetical protein